MLHGCQCWRAKERSYGLRPEASSIRRTSKHLTQKENTMNSLELGTYGVCSVWVLKRESMPRDPWRYCYISVITGRRFQMP